MVDDVFCSLPSKADSTIPSTCSTAFFNHAGRSSGLSSCLRPHDASAMVAKMLAPNVNVTEAISVSVVVRVTASADDECDEEVVVRAYEVDTPIVGWK